MRAARLLALLEQVGLPRLAVPLVRALVGQPAPRLHLVAHLEREERVHLRALAVRVARARADHVHLVPQECEAERLRRPHLRRQRVQAGAPAVAADHIYGSGGAAAVDGRGEVAEQAP